MGIGEAFLNVQIIYQNLQDRPIYYDKTNNRIIQNPKIKTPLKMRTWYSSTATLIFFMAVQLNHVMELVVAANSHKEVKPEDTIVTGFTIALMLQSLTTIYTLESSKGPAGA